MIREIHLGGVAALLTFVAVGMNSSIGAADAIPAALNQTGRIERGTSDITATELKRLP